MDFTNNFGSIIAQMGASPMPAAVEQKQEGEGEEEEVDTANYTMEMTAVHSFPMVLLTQWCCSGVAVLLHWCYSDVAMVMITTTTTTTTITTTTTTTTITITIRWSTHPAPTRSYKPL
jgi:hypothetical protein